MRLKIQLLLAVICFSFLSSTSVKAAGIVGGSITYSDVFGSPDSLIVYLNTVQVCSYSSAGSQVIDVSPASGTPFQLMLTSMGTGKDITPVSKGSCTLCTGGGTGCVPFGFIGNTYSTRISTKNYNCGLLTFSFKQCCRPSMYSTGLSGSEFYIKTVMNRCATSTNEVSPVQLRFPITVVCANQCTSLALDYASANIGDSLTYALYNVFDSTKKAAYSTGYDSSAPVKYTGSSPNDTWSNDSCKGFHLDKITGELKFKAKKSDTTAIGYKIEQWNRNSSGKPVKTCEIYSEGILDVVNCSANNPPFITGIDSGTSNTITVCEGQSFCFRVKATDADATDTVRLTDDHQIPGAVFAVLNPTKKNPTGQFCWAPPKHSASSRRPFQFVLTATDNHKPIPGRSQKVFNIYVRAVPPAVRLIKTYKGCNGYTFSTSNDTPYHLNNYVWYIDNQPAPASYDSVLNYHFDTGAVHYVMLLVKTDKYCGRSIIDTITIDTTSFPTVTYSKKYNGCNSYDFEAISDTSKHLRYQWTLDSGAAVIDTGQILKYHFASGLKHYINVLITRPNGCSKTISDSIIVDTTSFPNITISRTLNGCNSYTFSALTDSSRHVRYVWTVDDSTTVISTAQKFTYVFTGGSKHFIGLLLVLPSGCMEKLKDSVTFDPGFAHSVTKDTTICKTESVKLNVTGGKYHIWRPSTWLSDSTSSSPTATPDSTITYYVTSTDSMKCPQKDSVTITVDNDCVWPGDANKDKTVDLFDFLNVGVGYGATGSPRTATAINWQPYRATNWSKTTIAGVNYKHIDCNGDGKIDYKDTLAITKNYGSKHSKTDAIGKNGPPVKWVFATDTFYAGDTVRASLVLGDKNNALTNVYGIAAEYPVNTAMIKDNSLNLSFDCDLLCGSSPNLNWYRISPFGDKLSLVSVKTDNTGKSGYGKVATASFVLKDTTEYAYGTKGAALSILPSAIKLIDNAGSSIDVDAESDTVHLLKARRTAISQAAFDANDIHIYPNPAKEEVTIETGRNVLKQVIIYNALGSIIQTCNVIQQNKTVLNVNNLSAGVYFICLKGENFTTQQKLLIQK